MNSILVRITKTENLDLPGLFELLKNPKFIVIGCEEYPHSNPHYHFWIQTDYKLDTVQRKLKAIEGINGNKFTCKSAEGNLIYICKGPLTVSQIKKPDYPGVKSDPVIVINTMNITQEQILESHESWWANNSNLKNDKKSKKPKTFMEVIKEWWKQDKVYEKMVNLYNSRKLEIESSGYCVSGRKVELIHEVGRQIGMELMGKFKALDKLCDLPIIKKYTNYLILDIISTEELMSAWTRSSIEYF